MEDNNIAQKLINLLLSLSEGEENLLKQKQEAIDKTNLNPIKIFLNLDKEKKGFITKENFLDFLSKYNISHSAIDVNYFYFFYDKDNDNVLDFNEFLNLLIPDTNYFYKIYFKQKYNNSNFNKKQYGKNKNDMNSNELNILKNEIQLSKKINEMIQNIKYDSKNFSLEDIYLEIKGYSFITAESLKAFFDRYKIKYSDKDITNIFNRFSSLNTKGRINYNQLKKFFDLVKIGNNTTREKIHHCRVNSDIDIFKKRMNRKKSKDFKDCTKSNKNRNNYYENKRAINFNKNNNKSMKGSKYKDCSFSNSVCYNDNNFTSLYNDGSIFIDTKDDNSKNKNYSKNCSNNVSKHDFSFLFKEINFNKINGKNRKNINRHSSVQSINYKEYLKDKRNESLDKSFNKSYSRRSNVTPKKCNNCQGKFKNDNDVKINLKDINNSKNNQYNKESNIKNDNNIKNNNCKKNANNMIFSTFKGNNNHKTDFNNTKDNNITDDNYSNDNSYSFRTKKSLNYNKSNSNIHEKDNYNPQNFNLMNNNPNKSVIYTNNNLKSIIGDDDIKLKLPARLDRRLVKRKLAERKNISVPAKHKKFCCECRRYENNNNYDKYVKNAKYNKYENEKKNYYEKYKNQKNNYDIYEKTMKYSKFEKENNKNYHERYEDEKNNSKFEENYDNYYKKSKNKKNIYKKNTESSIDYYGNNKENNKNNDEYKVEENNNIYAEENNNYDGNYKIKYNYKEKNNNYDKFVNNDNNNKFDEENNNYDELENDNYSEKISNFSYIYKKAKPKNSNNSKRNESAPNFVDIKEFTFKDNDSNFSKKNIDYSYY